MLVVLFTLRLSPGSNLSEPVGYVILSRFTRFLAAEIIPTTGLFWGSLRVLVTLRPGRILCLVPDRPDDEGVKKRCQGWLVPRGDINRSDLLMTRHMISLLTPLAVVLSMSIPGLSQAGDKPAPVPAKSDSKPYDPAVQRKVTCARPSRHCSKPGSPSTAYMIRPVTYMKTVVETVYEPAQVKVPRTVYETVYEDQEVTLYRVVCETEMREQQYSVCRTVAETSEREITETFRRPVWETIEKECQYQERRLIRETSEREIRRKVCKPVTEQVMRSVRVGKVEPVTETRVVTEDLGRWVPRQVYRRGLMLPGLGQKPCGQLGLRWSPSGVCSTRLEWCPNPVSREVTCTRYVTRYETKEVPVTVKRIAVSEEVKTVPVETCRWVVETKTRKVPVRRLRYETKTLTRKIPVTTQKVVTETRTRQVPVRVTRRVPYTVTRRVPRQVSREIEVTCTKMLPRYIERQVPCTTQELVPVVVE